MAFQKFANKTTMNLFPINTLPPRHARPRGRVQGATVISVRCYGERNKCYLDIPQEEGGPRESAMGEQISVTTLRKRRRRLRRRQRIDPFVPFLREKTEREGRVSNGLFPFSRSFPSLI